MLLTVLMRWPALIVVLAIGGGAYAAYKEYGLPDSVELALQEVMGTAKKPLRINDSAARATGDAGKIKITKPASAPEPETP